MEELFTKVEKETKEWKPKYLNITYLALQSLTKFEIIINVHRLRVRIKGTVSPD
jgi:hypothetical protein